MEANKIGNLNDAYLIKPAKFGDDRGYFSPFFIQADYDKLGIDFKGVVQTNRSMSSKGVLRGLHFQYDPKCQAKIVEVISGAAIDVIVDCRKDSSTYGNYGAFLLTPENNNQLFVPRGYAHGFLSLEDNTIFQYLIDNDYAPSLEGGILWSDSDLNIPWEEYFNKYGIDRPLLSDKDKVRKRLCDTEIYFRRNK